MFRRGTMMALALVVLAACNGRRETSMTTAYGTGVLSGEVVLGQSIGGGSPGGVEVSVRGTGMSMRVGDDGQFAFAGVPAGVQLDFRRAADGIEASVRVDGDGYVTIELQKATATATRQKGSKRRGVGGSREPVYEFEGVIRTAAATSIVVFTSKKVEQTIALAPETVIRKGNRILAAADLTAGTRVHVKARRSGETYTAAAVLVQNEEGDDGGEDDRPAVREYEGVVRGATATQLVVFTSHREEVTFAITAETVIRKGNTTIAAADLRPGWRVHVKATAGAGGSATATQVIVQHTPAEEVQLEGTVESVGASSLVVSTASASITVRTSPSTQIRKGGKKIALAQIAAGDTVAVAGTRVDDTTVQAKKITVQG